MAIEVPAAAGVGKVWWGELAWWGVEICWAGDHVHPPGGTVYCVVLWDPGHIVNHRRNRYRKPVYNCPDNL